MRADAGAAFQGTEKGMAQKRLGLRHQGIPGARGNVGQIFQSLQRHKFLFT
jgi:hypothetical protein